MTATRYIYVSILAAWCGAFAAMHLLVPTCLTLAALCVIHWRALVNELETGA